jgi:hypothetical protein
LGDEDQTVYLWGIGAGSLLRGHRGAKAAGVWSVSGKLTSTGEKVQPTGTNVDQIKGWMTLDDVSSAYQVPVAEIVAAFELPPDTPGTTQLKSLESPTFSVTNLRKWLIRR